MNAHPTCAPEPAAAAPVERARQRKSAIRAAAGRVTRLVRRAMPRMREARPSATSAAAGPAPCPRTRAGDLVLDYEPYADPRTGHITAAEALVRRRHPDHGLLLPAAFVPAIAGHPLMPPLTLGVLEQALADARRWRAAGHMIQVAVHIAAPSLLDPSFAEGVAARLRTADIGADAVTLEVTEQTLRGHPVRGLAALARLRALGVQLALRDFRGDQSLLARLARLPVRELKLAPDVVAGVVGGADDRAIVAAIIGLAKRLDMRVVADRVGDAETWTMLAGMGCHRIQGSYLARPMPAAALDRWLADEARLHGARALGTGPRALTVGILRGWPSPTLSSASGRPPTVPGRTPPPGV